ncbi:class II fructose-bisphosphate aldolase [Parageobacillus sp. VR-IP]|uniref:class II fructose-bisphosphate aldolase n=1 Tax=Parageobacillus sp. VR-IP TaxID=2742205 RepID=UPI001583AFBB|nr:class II fructose-bisphosphate aldolase [Parageobacillus sp. VR-IP]NUK30259.1 class II fructose-bisphosphate aldolase [Parageobacillus sp. VR-IP]
MNKKIKFKNVLTLKKVLEQAEKNGYAVGSFSPRYIPMIRPVLRAAQKTKSPIIVQISQKEMDIYEIKPFEFAAEFYRVLEEEAITVPVVLHLDHTKELSVIKEAIAAGFTSVMIDASDKPLLENMKITKEVVEYAHSKGVSVEAELGKIGSTDLVETDTDEELYTDPKEAMLFVNETKCDALAVSIGTAHGVYQVQQPKLDFKRLRAIRELTPVHLVLHGGSGVPSEMIQKAIHIPCGGISKVNIATDLEVALLEALGRKKRMTNSECKALSKEQLALAQTAVEQIVIDKITNFLGSKARSSELF